ncbi:MAG TPA: patatin-like phospholipase family protein [Longimicrobiales bacterium]|nr:patatin-like phospholipase family protein [Longimicrobiales bacterium]
MTTSRDGRREPGAGPPLGAPGGTDDVTAFLASTELFGDLDPAALRELAPEIEWVLVSGGEEVCRQGEPGTSLFLVASGKLRVLVEDAEGEERMVRELGRGENVGEMSLLTGAPRSATVRAVRDSILARLTAERFEGVLAKHPAAALALTRMLARWLGRSNERRRMPALPVTMALRAASDGVPLRRFCERLAGALGRIGPILHLRAEEVDAALHPGAADEEEGAPGYRNVTRWLYDLEAHYRFVLYEASPTRPAWTRRCARQADRLLTVARGDGDPAGTSWDTPPEGSGALTNLVLLHPDDTARPSGTRRWEPERYDAHHHVRLGVRSDYERLSRHLTGRAVGLVLGGGGARGFAHLGVVRAMEEAGVSVDRIGGTSMGAVMAAMVAMGLDYDAIVRTCLDTFPRFRPDRDYTLPLVSLLAGRRGARLCRELFGDTAVEDLWIPYFCCSANLTRSELVVHREGPLARRVLASVSIPGIVPPVVDEHGDLLVDGGVLSNVPAEVMLQSGGGPVLAVDASQKEDLSLDAWHGTLPSWRDVLADRLRPSRPRRPYPNIFHILVRSSTLNSVRQAQRIREEVDLYLEPPVEGFELFQWDAVGEIAEAGYRYALERIRRWEGLDELLERPEVRPAEPLGAPSLPP